MDITQSVKRNIHDDERHPFFGSSSREAMPIQSIITVRPRRNGLHLADDISICIFPNENIWISINSSLKFVPKGQIDYNPALVQTVILSRPGDEPLSAPMMVILLTYICVTRQTNIPSIKPFDPLLVGIMPLDKNDAKWQHNWISAI